MVARLDVTPAQRQVLVAVADAAFQAHSDEVASELAGRVSGDKRDLVSTFVKTQFSDLPGSIDAVLERFNSSLSPENLKSTFLALTLLSTTAGTLLLTGYASPFPSLTVEQREASLKSWRTSRFPILRSIFQGLVSVSLFVAYSAFDDKILAATGYPIKGDENRHDYSSSTAEERAHHLFEFEPFPTATVDGLLPVVETEMLVLGSGAGGGVVSSELAKKGWKVLVVEKGEYVRPSEMGGTQKEGMGRLYELGGLMVTEDGGLTVLAGATFGGGTTVNWSASLRPQHFLRQQWAKDHRLPHFLSEEYTRSIEAVCERMGVSDEASQHNKANQILVSGSKKLGYPIVKIPQNTAGRPHACGFCGYGCPYGSAGKQGGTSTWLRDTASNGGKFLIRSTVDRLLFASSPTAAPPTSLKALEHFSPSRKRKHCIGALVKNEQGDLAVLHARKAVVVSAGSLHSPAILLRSGLKNPRIGQNLRLHPVAFVTGFYAEPVRAWEGAIMTAVSCVEENWDGTSHGTKIEVVASMPGAMAAGLLGWSGSEEQKRDMVAYEHTATFCIIARDKGSGRILLDSSNNPRMHYTLSPYDAVSITRGTIAAAEIHLAAGAERIVTTQVDVDDFLVPKGDFAFLTDERWKSWIKKVEVAGTKPGRCALGSAHQMGSCQMGVKSSTSVVDPRGRVWDTKGLYVADASVFPSASGVNPMITNMSISHGIAGWIDEDARLAVNEPAKAHL